MTSFRPCIDLHQGRVKQIVGSSLRDAGPGPTTNFVAAEPGSDFARRYREDGLVGGHVIMLGPGNDEAATNCLESWPSGLQLGGGIAPENAERWLAAGAGKLIVTSWLFVDGELSMERVRRLSQRIGAERLVIDLSCRRVGEGWWVATDRWQTVSRTQVDRDTCLRLADHCSEFLVHAADVEGKCEGIDDALVSALAQWSPIPCTYAGGARELGDLDRVARLSEGRIDLTFGSALDIFGGEGVRYSDCVEWNRRDAGLRGEADEPGG